MGVESLEINICKNSKNGLKSNIIKMPDVVAHCNCPGAHEHNGLKIGHVVRGMSGFLQVTKAAEDVCSFCGFYVYWAEEVINDKRRGVKGAKGTKRR